LETVTGHGTLDEIQQTLDLLWDRHPEVSAMARMHMELAACEIGANICKHSGGGQPVGMRMKAEVSGSNVRVSFADDGQLAEVRLDAVTMPSDTAEQGRGLAIAVAILDKLSFRRDAAVNRWTLVRRLSD